MKDIALGIDERKKPKLPYHKNLSNAFYFKNSLIYDFAYNWGRS